MSRRHNTKHPDRSRSNYPRRLKKRGVSSRAVRMPSLLELRHRALVRVGENPKSARSRRWLAEVRGM